MSTHPSFVHASRSRIKKAWQWAMGLQKKHSRRVPAFLPGVHHVTKRSFLYRRMALAKMRGPWHRTRPQALYASAAVVLLMQAVVDGLSGAGVVDSVQRSQPPQPSYGRLAHGNCNREVVAAAFPSIRFRSVAFGGSMMTRMSYSMCFRPLS